MYLYIHRNLYIYILWYVCIFLTFKPRGSLLVHLFIPHQLSQLCPRRRIDITSADFLSNSTVPCLNHDDSRLTILFYDLSENKWLTLPWWMRPLPGNCKGLRGGHSKPCINSASLSWKTIKSPRLWCVFLNPGRMMGNKVSYDGSLTSHRIDA